MSSVLPRAVRALTRELTRLPGIGPKTAQRLSIYLLRQPSVTPSAEVNEAPYLLIRRATKIAGLFPCAGCGAKVHPTEAETLNAQAEVERAKGMAKAMEIENGQLTEVYNQYLFIRSLESIAQHGDLPQIIYLPTEGMLPVMDLKIKNQNYETNIEK